MELYGLGFDYITTYPGIINALTPEYVNEVARLRLSSENYVAAMAGPNIN
jgi:predicted Zn-dependent peptidase